MQDYLKRLDFITIIEKAENIERDGVDEKVQNLLDQIHELGCKNLNNDLLATIEAIKIASFVEGGKMGIRLSKILKL